MTGRLINADDLKDWSEIVPLTGDGGIDINDFDEKLKSMPTVEAIPVEWINKWMDRQDSWNREGVITLMRDWNEEKKNE